MRRLAIGAALLLLLLLGSSAWLNRPVVEGRLDAAAWSEMRVAPLDRALTLARTRDGAVLLVLAADRAGVTAVDLGAAAGARYDDAIAAWQALGAAGLRALADAPVAKHAWAALAVPVRALPVHIAAGTNYAEHAEEVGHEDDPFLFPKRSAPTAWNADVPAGARLDYEVELCAVTMAAHVASRPAPLGYLLCNDMTDRWLLVRDIDLEGPMGRTGFPLGKGGVGRLPVGALLVIPEDEAFYGELELSLYLNDVLRQRDRAGNMIWSPRTLLERALADCEAHYVAGDERLRLTDCESLPAGTLLLTGTPGGVLFKLPTFWNPWAYLRPGDTVVSLATYLGPLRNVIASP